MNLLRSRLLLFPALTYGILSIVCTQIPLLNYLGYEFSAFFAMLSSIVAGVTAIGVVKRGIVLSEPSSQKPVHPAFVSVKDSIVLNFVLLIIPLVVILTNAMFVKNCSLLEGLGFFFLLPVVSVIFSCAVGFFCAVHYRFPKSAFFAFVVATLVYAAALGYFTPSVYSYNFFYGYFPGLTYDEALGIGWTLVVFRLFTLLIAGVFVWMGMIVLNTTSPDDSVSDKGLKLLAALTKPPRIYVSLFILLMFGLIYFNKGELGLESHSDFIRGELREKAETPHFVIYYSRESYGNEEIKWVAAEHEFRLRQIVEVFNLPFDQKIASYVYPSNEVKQRLIGTGTTNIAKPWRREIHSTTQSLDATLKHELVHVLAAPFGLPVIGASLSTGLVEGLAMAIEWDWGNRTLHQYAAAMQRFGVAPDIRTLMLFTGFAAQSSSVSYVLAGSFCRYLIDRYGIRKMVQLYRSNDYELFYGRSLDELISEWQNFLARIPVAEEDRDAIDVLFRRPPIFQKVCARVLAARNIEAQKRFAARDFKVSAQLYEQSYQEGRGYDALSGYLSSSLYAKDFAILTAALDTVLLHDSKPPQYLPLFLNIGMAFWAEGNLARARQLFERVAIANLSESLTEAALVRNEATRESSSREKFLHYFLSATNDTVRLAILDSLIRESATNWLSVYLKGKTLSRLQRWDDALTTLRSLDPGLEEPRLEAIRLKTIGGALFRLKEFQDARVAFWMSLNSVASEVAQNDVNDWIERCEWM
ncbi:MAG: hypothetical protein HY708_07400, partial [Ignavibacteriae bacterium]|nr:hypothetical protein [Ignavibacteriota bacterium]